ncbi:MAG: L-threonylcarbamoyladenylate synthase [Patescibacteria group bacterium]
MQTIKQENLNLEEVVAALRAGQTIVYPTETCYGLGCDATNQSAVDRVFRIKQRQKDKTVLVVVPDESMVVEYIEWNETIEKLARRYWPGPLTIVAYARANTGLADGVVAKNGTAAFRVVDHPIASALSAGLGKPLVSTSANISSYESPYSFEKVADMFGGQEDQPDILIDAGELLAKSVSTVARVKKGSIQILRQGVVVVEL